MLHNVWKMWTISQIVLLPPELIRLRPRRLNGNINVKDESVGGHGQGGRQTKWVDFDIFQNDSLNLLMTMFMAFGVAALIV